MQRPILLSAALMGMTLCFASAGRADVPAPPVNQTIGMLDVAFGTLTEADCRECHASGVPDRHHNLYGHLVQAGELDNITLPNKPAVGEPLVCLSCHESTGSPTSDPDTPGTVSFKVERDCTVCHTASPHHTTPDALDGKCAACHGSFVNNVGDGHYVPGYALSLVTPSVSGGDGLPLNDRGSGAGACNYCHDDDGLPTPVILTTPDLHHDATKNCSWCHQAHGGGSITPIRLCEGCHGLESLHNIQADSPNPNNIGTLVVGGEDAGYGHVGRDAGPGDSDCWGCHGFAMASAPATGPIVPTVYWVDHSVVRAGTATAVKLSGSAFTNIARGALFRSQVALTAADGGSLTLTPIHVNDRSMAVVIPADTAAGNYDLRAVKARSASNPAVISVVPQVVITRARSSRRGTVIIDGRGFAGHAAGSGTSVTTTRGWRRTRRSEEARVIFWSDRRIVAAFSRPPDTVLVHSVFGTARASVLGR